MAKRKDDSAEREAAGTKLQSHLELEQAAMQFCTQADYFITLDMPEEEQERIQAVRGEVWEFYRHLRNNRHKSRTR